MVDLLAGLTRARAVRLDLPEELHSDPMICPTETRDVAEERVVCQETLHQNLSVRLSFLDLTPGSGAVCDEALAHLMLGVLIPRLNAEIAKRSALSTLSDAERRVLDLVQLPNTEIASRLGIEHDTVRTHLKRIYRKLGVNDRQDLVAFARRFSLT